MLKSEKNAMYCTSGHLYSYDNISLYLS